MPRKQETPLQKRLNDYQSARKTMVDAGADRDSLDNKLREEGWYELADKYYVQPSLLFLWLEDYLKTMNPMESSTSFGISITQIDDLIKEPLVVAAVDARLASLANLADGVSKSSLVGLSIANGLDLRRIMVAGHQFKRTENKPLQDLVKQLTED